MGIGRSENMRRIRSRDTVPEMVVRKALRQLGHSGYRLHRSDLPGRPDVAFLGKKKAIFVHGCFWHGHDCAEGKRTPKSNVDYGLPKIERNRLRDNEKMRALENDGWSVLVLWECELGDAENHPNWGIANWGGRRMAVYQDKAKERIQKGHQKGLRRFRNVVARAVEHKAIRSQ